MSIIKIELLAVLLAVCAVAAAVPQPTISVVLHSAGGGVTSCTATSVNYDSGTATNPHATVVEIESYVCPPDFIFRGGFQ